MKEQIIKEFGIKNRAELLLMFTVMATMPQNIDKDEMVIGVREVLDIYRGLPE